MWTLLTCFATLGYNCRSIKVREGIAILVNIGNFLVLQGYLMGSMYGMDSILLWRNPYGVWKQLL
jgi:hypothetical protein